MRVRSDTLNGQGVRRILVSAVALAFLAACSQGSAPLAPSKGPAIFAQVWQQARDDGATDAQLAIVSDAAESGELTYEDVMLALDGTFTCFDNSGVMWGLTGIDTSRGFPIPDYFWGGGTDDDEVNRLSNLGGRCLKENSYYVELLYQIQPSSVQAEESNFEERKALILACLDEQGLVLPADSTQEEIGQAVSAVLTGYGTLELPTEGSRIVDCLGAGL